VQSDSSGDDSSVLCIELNR